MGFNKRIKIISLFDFDETIANAPGKIGISSKLGDDFILSFLNRNNIKFEKFQHSNHGDITFYLDSHNFRKYKNAVNSCEKTKQHQILDFSAIAGFDAKDAQPIYEPFQKMINRHKTTGCLTGIITARAGKGFEKSISGTGFDVPITNAIDIQEFLRINGGFNLPIGDPPRGHISTIGDIGGRPVDKANIVEQYIRVYDPEIIEFHDDDRNNVEGVRNVVKKYKDVDIRLYFVRSGRLFRV